MHERLTFLTVQKIVLDPLSKSIQVPNPISITNELNQLLKLKEQNKK